jgi:hypothetical protein
MKSSVPPEITSGVFGAFRGYLMAKVSSRGVFLSTRGGGGGWGVTYTEANSSGVRRCGVKAKASVWGAFRGYVMDEVSSREVDL